MKSKTVALDCPYCGRRHRSWYNFARCHFRRGLIWVQGDPPINGPCWATVSHCRKGRCSSYLTVTLWETAAEAEQAKAGIDRWACGGGCCRHHRVYTLHEGE